MNYILEYWQQIESGKVIVSARVRKQYKKLAERIKKPEGRYIFDEKRANRPMNKKIIKGLDRVTKNAVTKLCR